MDEKVVKRGVWLPHDISAWLRGVDPEQQSASAGLRWLLDAAMGEDEFPAHLTPPPPGEHSASVGLALYPRQWEWLAEHYPRRSLGGQVRAFIRDVAKRLADERVFA